MPPWYNIELPSLHHYDNPPDLDVADERNPSPQPHISDSRTHNAPWASRGTLNDSTDNLWRTDSPPSTAAGHQDARTPILSQHETFRCSVGTKSPLQSKRERFLMTWLTCAAAIISTIFSVYYSYTVLVSDKAVPQALSLSPGKTVMAINVLSHVVAYLLWSLVTDANEELRWSLACRPEGVTLTSFLVLSRATPLHGVAYLCTVWGGHILWALQKWVCTVQPSDGHPMRFWGALPHLLILLQDYCNGLGHPPRPSFDQSVPLACQISPSKRPANILQLM
jgi:hypothetical protein